VNTVIKLRVLYKKKISSVAEWLFCFSYKSEANFLLGYDREF
jgi:hypothetical protein